MIGRPGKSVEEKLNNYKVDEATGCWIWQGQINRTGYGTVRFNNKTTTAHRAYYDYYVQPVPAELQVDHLCKVRACINPAHMEIVTPIENNLRSDNPISQVMLTNICKRGHVLTSDNVYRQGRGRACIECRKVRAADYLAESTCQLCGKVFKVDKYRLHKAKFCSLDCAAKSHRGKPRKQKVISGL